MTVGVSSTEATEGQISSGFWALALGSIGVVFGDIGTSPLYAFREAVADAAHGAPVTRAMVPGGAPGGFAESCAWAAPLAKPSAHTSTKMRAARGFRCGAGVAPNCTRGE